MKKILSNTRSTKERKSRIVIGRIVAAVPSLPTRKIRLRTAGGQSQESPGVARVTGPECGLE
jgi:hypothetical protein